MEFAICGTYLDHDLKKTLKNIFRSSHCGSKNLTCIQEDAVRSLASLSGLRIWHCHELWSRSQMQLRSGIAVAVV